MNRFQKAILRKFVVVISVTILTVLVMVNYKDWINREESIRAMEHLSSMVLQYKKEFGSVPPESYIDNLKEDLYGYERLGDLQYRAVWIDSDSEPNEILAYSERYFKSLFVKDGVVVLTLDGLVQWMDIKQFEPILDSQQSPMEKAKE
jgi:hypothetical protein